MVIIPSSPTKSLVFDIWSDFGHFRKIETTTSPLTYFVPTPPALSGLISAIVGLERDSYYNIFSPDNVKFAIRPLNPLKKLGININLIKTDDGFYLWDIKGTPRSPTPFEFLKNPSYRIYLQMNTEEHAIKELYDKLKKFLQNHQSFYTPFLGISEMIAEFKFVGEFEIKKHENQCNINTFCVIRKDKTRIIIENDKKYVLERVPLFMDAGRVVQKYIDVIFEADNKHICIKSGEAYKIGEENVIFL